MPSPDPLARVRAGSLRLADPPPETSAPEPHELLATIGGVAARKRLHALHPATPGQEAATAGFALALALSLERSRDAPVLWVQDGQAAAEAGRPYGHGLASLGLDPARLVVVAVKGAMNALAAAEMGLEEVGLAGVLVDLPTRLPADMLRLGKRLSLRAEARETPCFLLHASPEPVDAPVATRWHVSSRAPAGGGGAQGAVRGAQEDWAQEDRTPPYSRAPRTAYRVPDFTTAFDLTLTKNRFGALGRWRVDWRAPLVALPVAFESHVHASASRDIRRFAFATALPEPLAAAAGDRPAAAPLGEIVPWPTAA